MYMMCCVCGGGGMGMWQEELEGSRDQTMLKEKMTHDYRQH